MQKNYGKHMDTNVQQKFSLPGIYAIFVSLF